MFTFKWLFVVKLVQGSNSEYKGKWKEQNCPNNRDYKFFLLNLSKSKMKFSFCPLFSNESM